MGLYRDRYFDLNVRQNLDLIFSLQFERAVNRDNTVSFQHLSLQIEVVRWRATLAGCTVRVHQHLDGTLTVTHGPQRLGRCSVEGKLRFNKMAASRLVNLTTGQIVCYKNRNILICYEQGIIPGFSTAQSRSGITPSSGSVEPRPFAAMRRRLHRHRW